MSPGAVFGDQWGVMKKDRGSSAILQTVISGCIILIAVILIVIVGILGSISGRSDQESEETVEVTELDLCYPYRNAQWNSAIEQVIAAFEEEYPQIRINYEAPYADSVYENELNKRIARGELGDIVQLKTPKAYALSGLLGGIPEELAEELGIESIYEAEDGVIYGLGMVNCTSGIIYNKEIFEQYGLSEPETYDEFLQICEILQYYGVTPIGVGGDDLWHMEFWVNHFFRTDILTQDENWQAACSDGTVSWTDDEVTEMFEHLLELFRKGYVNEDWLSTTDGSLPYMMTEGEIAMVYTGAWTAEEIYALDSEIELGWFYLPDEEGNICVDEMQDTFWSITAECEADEAKYEAALAFLEFFYEESTYTGVLSSMTAFPTTNGEYSFELTGIQEQVRDAFEDNETHITGFVGDEQTPQGFEEVMLSAVQSMLTGELTVEEAQQRCQKAWEEYLEEVE